EISKGENAFERSTGLRCVVIPFKPPTRGIGALDTMIVSHSDTDAQLHAQDYARDR
ncbi:MAG: hypothetical protein V7606_2258, partial [Burkholderiales bacterium]